MTRTLYLFFAAMFVLAGCEQSVSIRQNPTGTVTPDDPPAESFDLPIADAGPQQQIAPLVDVQLDGTAS